jgi:nucleoside-diphosphate-sugar epimerase
VKPLSNAIAQNALGLASKAIESSDRVLVTGATGWFGQTAVALVELLGIQKKLIASRSRDFMIGSREFHAEVWNDVSIRQFKPTVVIDAAYITREFANSFSGNDYVTQNRLLTNRLISLVEIPTLRKVVTFSSGDAAKHLTKETAVGIDKDPYGFLKFEAENAVAEVFSKQGIDYSIIRAWSLSGALVTKIHGFAFSDLIAQALNGRVEVHANRRVYRRYCLIEEAIAIGLNHNSSIDGVLDTGGSLIEIHDLSAQIVGLVNPLASVTEADYEGNTNDCYFSNNSSWERSCKKSGLLPLSITDQITHVFNWMKD